MNGVKDITDPTNNNESELENEFERESKLKAHGILVEFGDFLIHNKKWWLTPIIIVLLTFSLFIILTNTVLWPFIYVLF